MTPRLKPSAERLPLPGQLMIATGQPFRQLHNKRCRQNATC